MNARYLYKPLMFVIPVIVLAATLLPAGAGAYVPYNTNYKDNFGRMVWTQSAYTPVELIGREIYLPDPNDATKTKLVHSPLSQPKDLFIDANDHMYIADTGNNRIVHLDNFGQLVRVIDLKQSPMKKPEGLFIDNKGNIFVADTGNKRVLKLDKDGNLLKEYGRPNSKFLPEAFKYDPIKLIVDKRGFLYVATLGGYQGLLQMDPEGNFQSFFGANKTTFSAMDALKRVLYTREMYLREISKLPGSVASVTVDQAGLIYTVTKEVATGQIKKYNVAGKDLLAAKDEYSGVVENSVFGEFRFRLTGTLKPQLSDLTVDSFGNITAIDSSLKYVNQYDSSGNLLFFWGGDSSASSTKLGVVKTPSAIANNSKNELFILDEENNAIQHFRLSEFGALVHQANALTQEGRYEDSEKYWQEVVRLNASYTPAVLGLAKAAYKKGDYKRAETLFLEAGNVNGYSDAFWQLRLNWFQTRFGLMMNILIIAAVVLFVFNRLTRKSAWRQKLRKGASSDKDNLGMRLRHVFYILKHPIDGFTGIRYENKGSFASSFILLAIAIASFCIMRAGTDFMFNPTVVLGVNLVTVFLQFIVLWVGWSVSNYLISTIYRGEGRFRDVLYGSAYAMFPFFLMGLPLTILSKVMSLSEASIFNFLEGALIAWVGLLIFWNVQAIQNYSVGETAFNIFLSLITMTILGVLLFITFGLSSELKDFLFSVFQEVTIR